MSKKQLLAAILELEPERRAELLREVDDRLERNVEAAESPEFIADLEHRTQTWIKNPNAGAPWEQVNEEMKALIRHLQQRPGKSKSTASQKSNSRRRSSTTN